MNSVRAARAALPLLFLLGLGNSPTAVEPSPATRDSSPVARVCVLHDFGVPRTRVPYTTNDPVWQNDPALLAEGRDGWIYTTSPLGGKDNNNQGTIYRIHPETRQLDLLHSFDVRSGAGPRGGLIGGRRPDGTYQDVFYGTTYGGGEWGFGTVFRIAPGETEPTTIYSFRNGRMDGWEPDPCPTSPRCPFSPRQRAQAAASYPISAPVLAADGFLYGVTSYSNNQGFGVFYRLAPSGGDNGFTAICIFDPRMLADRDMKPFVCDAKVSGAHSVTLGNDGRTIFGTTVGGYGSVWKSTGGGITVLHSFGLSDGSKPVSLLQASDDYLYGTTWAGGEVNAGTVFRLGPSGFFFKVLTSFRIDYYLGNFSPGLIPAGRLVEKLDTLSLAPLETETFLYGTAKYGGRGGRGTIYRLRRDGSDLKVVHHFPYNWAGTGRSASSGLLLHSRGALYGTTYQGGTYDHGVLFSVTGTGLPDIPDPTVPPKFSGGVVAKDAAGRELKDDLITVKIDGLAFQVWSGTGPDPNAYSTYEKSIRFEVNNCRTPHLVQFIYREEIMASHPPVWREGMTDIGYPLTTDPARPEWDVDVGRYAGANAYFDEVPRNPVLRGPFSLMIADQPSVGAPQRVNADKLGVADDTRRATFRTYLYCNCELQRLVEWRREQAGPGPPAYTNLALRKTTPADVEFINGLVKAQKFLPIP